MDIYLTILPCVRVAGWCCSPLNRSWVALHQVSGCEYAVKRSRAPLGLLFAIYIGIYGHMQPYRHAYQCIYKLKICLYIIIHLFSYLVMFLYFYIHVYLCI